VASQIGLIQFSDEEANLGFASAVARVVHPGDWEPIVPHQDQAQVLLRLVDNPDPEVRLRAATALGARFGDGVAEALVRLALADQSPDVRSAAAQAIAGPEINEKAVMRLTAAVQEQDQQEAALDALASVRDLQPEVQAVLPRELQGPLRRTVWGRRWRRHQSRLWGGALQGLQAGFWGMALGLGVFLGFWNASLSLGANNPLRLYFGVLLLGMSLAGVLGALSVGGGRFLRVVLESLQDYAHPIRDWLLVTALSTALFSLGLVLVGAVSAGAPRPLETALAGVLIGLAVAGTATFPSRLPWAARLVLPALAGAASFMLVGYLDLFFNRDYGWLLAMGLACGAGFTLGFWSPSKGGVSDESMEAVR
jgi:hypothetical protein